MEDIVAAKNTFAWLEITGKCQLKCGHCYADSGPQGTHGTMELADWLRAIGELAAAGVDRICVIGGEPTLHPDLGAIVDHALASRMQVEVYTNLVHVSEEQWRLFERRRVSLATSFYSSEADEHARIVGRATYARTTANIEEARRRGIPVRAGMVRVLPAQQIAAAKEVLGRFGIRQIHVDDLRGVGRGAGAGTPDVSALCGRCASGRVAITPDGDVYPCVFSRFLPVGNVRQASLTEILNSEPLARTRAELTRVFTERSPKACDPDCGPNSETACVPTNGDGRGHVIQGVRPARSGLHNGCTPEGDAECGPSNGECDPTSCAPTVGGNYEDYAIQACDPDCGPKTERSRPSTTRRSRAVKRDVAPLCRRSRR